MNGTKADQPDIPLHQCADLTDVINMDGFEDNRVYFYLPQSLVHALFLSTEFNTIDFHQTII
jgi:hypothetical protein